LKRAGDELDYGPRNSTISEFVESEMARLASSKAEYENNRVPYEDLDKIFQDGLQEVWA
jgi:hypothetical protein